MRARRRVPIYSTVSGLKGRVDVRMLVLEGEGGLTDDE